MKWNEMKWNKKKKKVSINNIFFGVYLNSSPKNIYINIIIEYNRNSTLPIIIRS